jgi:hypothetical protein
MSDSDGSHCRKHATQLLTPDEPQDTDPLRIGPAAVDVNGRHSI